MNSEAHAALKILVALALAEDHVAEDVTEKFLPVIERSEARLRARQPGIYCGVGISEEVFAQAGLSVTVERRVEDGNSFAEGDTLEVWRGPGSMTSVERIVLNMLQHLGAIATETHRWVGELQGTSCQLYDTRKTTPGWRLLEKHAVVCGGGFNHRLHLADALMVKDNHLERSGNPRGDDLTTFVRGLVGRAGVPVIVEVEDLESCLAVAQAEPAVILLDNMNLAIMTACVASVNELKLSSRPFLEASGGVGFKGLQGIAATGVDRISAGGLTQSPPRLDLGLDWYT